jgi:hypothetical protein
MGGAASVNGVSSSGPVVFSKDGQEQSMQDIRLGRVRDCVCLYAGLRLRDLVMIRSAGVGRKSHLLKLVSRLKDNTQLNEIHTLN